MVLSHAAVLDCAELSGKRDHSGPRHVVIGVAYEKAKQALGSLILPCSVTRKISSPV
jgi:hypothetical protein